MNTRHILLYTFWLVVLGPALVSAQVIRPEDLAAFLERSSATYRTKGEPDIESVLYDIAKANPSPDQAVAAFALRLNVSTDVARAYAALIIESTTIQEVCSHETPPCSFDAGGKLHNLMSRARTIDGSGRVLAVVARNLASAGADRDINGAAFIRLVAAHPASSVVFRSLLDWTSEPLYLGGVLASTASLDERAIIGAIAATDFDSTAGQRSGWIEAMLESATLEASRTAAPAARAALAQAAILIWLERGMNDEALALYDGLPADVRALLPLPASTCATAAENCERLERAGYRFVDEVASALALAGRRQDALTMVGRRIGGSGVRSLPDEQRHEAVVDALMSKRPRGDLFELFIRGHLPGQAAPDPSAIEALMDGPGWLFQVSASSPALRRVVAGRLRASGYADMATFLEAPAAAYDGSDRDQSFEVLGSMFLPRVRERRVYWQQRIEAASTIPATPTPSPMITTVSIRDLPPWWLERRLPANIEPWSESDVAITPPESLSLPIDRDAVVRYERQAGEHILIYESADYDLPGELPALGLWFVRTVSGTWSRPTYLGLQQHYPYVVTAGSRLPLLDGEVLRIEVQVQEIDSATITFPPIGLGLARSESGVYLEIDLARVLADRDRDGLTDIEERRLGLDFTKVDSDGDGMGDGVDPLPLTPFRAVASRSSRLARAILSQVVAHDARAIVVPVAAGRSSLLDPIKMAGAPRERPHTPAGADFLVADPALFAGVATSSRLLIYSQADVQALQRGAAPFYPPRIEQLFSSLDGRTHYVSWSAQWTGGAFVVTCRASGECDVQTLSSWVT